MYEGDDNCAQFWWKKYYGRRPVGRPRHRWKIILKGILKSGRTWFLLVQGRIG